MADGYRLLEEAQADLDDIAAFGAEFYSVDRVLAYDEELHSAFERLVEFPELGKLVPERSDTMRALPVEQHIVFYRPVPAPILIVRVMHQRADWSNILSEGQ